ncbi:hypothetical protein EYF80_038871 [Liparis tanakae]|uniref:Uncharacterized protein n=1 Tax=Liparis tanakae TaxID=230148 RepID=A0A4Z2GBG5_9TELE|nr:hypothetical protein EYF80_038871 [Liparis tanakae]
MPGASVPGILRRIFLQNCRMSLQDVSRSFSSTARVPSARRGGGTHSDVVRQLHGAVLVLIGQVDAVQVLRGQTLSEYTRPPAKLSCSPTAPFSPARSTQFSFRSNFSWACLLISSACRHANKSGDEQQHQDAVVVSAVTEEGLGHEGARRKLPAGWSALCSPPGKQEEEEDEQDEQNRVRSATVSCAASTCFSDSRTLAVPRSSISLSSSSVSLAFSCSSSFISFIASWTEETAESGERSSSRFLSVSISTISSAPKAAST